MPPQLESAVRTDSLVVRATFFGTRELLEAELEANPEPFSARWPTIGSRSPNLDEIAAALAGLDKTLSFATALTTSRSRLKDQSLAKWSTSSKLAAWDFNKLQEFLANASERERSEFQRASSQSPAGLAALRSWLDATKAPRHHDLYSVVSIEMRSPLQVLIEIPAEAYPALVPGLVLLAYKICRFGPRVSAARAKDLRDKAMYDQQKKLILEGKADAFAFVLAEHPMPDRMDFLGPGEDPDVVEMEQLSAPATDR